MRGPLCTYCHCDRFVQKQVGWLFKRNVMCRVNCDTKHDLVQDMSQPAKELGKKVRRMIIDTLKA